MNAESFSKFYGPEKVERHTFQKAARLKAKTDRSQNLKECAFDLNAGGRNLMHPSNGLESPVLRTQRLQTLDLFRGLAALSVMLLHYTSGYREHYGQSYAAFYDFRYGYLGVQLFFIISGFVIFLTVVQSKSVFDFLYKRLIRLYPVFLVCLVVTFSLVSVLGLPGREKSLHTAVINLSMMPGFFNVPAVDGAYWSLIPEVFFYVFTAVVMAAKQLKNIIIICAVLLLTTWIDQYVYNFPLQWSMVLNVKWNALFFAGILFYKLKFENPSKRPLIHLMLMVCFVTTCLSMPGFTERLIIGCFFIIFYLFSYNKLEWLVWKPFAFLGMMSYPLYLVHQNVGYIFLNYLKPVLWNLPVIFIGSAVVSLAAFSYLIHRYFEVPSLLFFRRIKRRHFDF